MLILYAGLAIIGIWFIVDVIAGFLQTRNVLFFWQVSGIMLLRPLLDYLAVPGGSWLGLIGACGMSFFILAVFFGLVAEESFREYRELKRNRLLLDWLICRYPSNNV